MRDPTVTAAQLVQLVALVTALTALAAVAPRTAGTLAVAVLLLALAAAADAVGRLVSQVRRLFRRPAAGGRPAGMKVHAGHQARGPHFTRIQVKDRLPR